MKLINQVKNSKEPDRTFRAEQLVKETKILNIARLAKMLVDLFGLDDPFQKVGKHAGKEIEMYLKELDGYITFVLLSERKNFECYAKKSGDPSARITINVKEELILKVLSSIIRSKSNIFGLVKLLKYLIPGKARIKGSYIVALKLVRCLMIGKHEVYKQST